MPFVQPWETRSRDGEWCCDLSHLLSLLLMPLRMLHWKDQLNRYRSGVA